MKKKLVLFVVFFIYIGTLFGSEFIIYVDEKGNQKKVDSIKDIYDIGRKIEDIELDLSKPEKQQKLIELKKIYKEKIEGKKLLDDIKEIELKLDSISEFEKKANKLNIEIIKKKEREKIRKLRLAISSLESKNLGNKRQLERLKKELREREKRLKNLDRTLEKVTFLKSKLERRLEKFKKESFIIYEVKKGDFLWKILNKSEFYGKGSIWPLIYKYNMDIIKDPDLIKIGWKIKIPIKKYKIGKNDKSLYNIAEKIYNDGSKWKWIYWANQDKIKNPNKIKIG